ncbi:E3 ubiquitin-protein ligase CHFR-like [Carassius carassius]|uniref:E3 ubiquitin-protein ligase CHFR-like n=1 Tax=Carassius carassius TaxID=217509 RepID=UPI0028684582|nr:E3 ubiquitin-protein ligase CHFR-like [Carassius carassius]
MMICLFPSSTNGTVINMSKVVKTQTHLLQNGDVIHFVYRKNEPEENIAYVYHAIGPQESASQDTEVSESNGAFTPDANEVLNASDLHFKSMQRHDRNVSSDGSESGCPLPEPASAAEPTVPPRRRAQKRPMEQPSEVKGQLLEAPAPPPRSEDELFLLSLAPSLQNIGGEEDSDLRETESEPVPVEPVIVKPLIQAGHEDPQPSTSSFHFYNMPLSSCSDYRIAASSFLCYRCGLCTFRELAYKYREHIPPTDLPGNSTTFVSRLVVRTEAGESGLI